VAELSEQQIIDLAFTWLNHRDAEIFVWHHFGRKLPGQPRSPKWTFGELSRHFKGMSFSTVTKSLRTSAKVMLEARRRLEETMVDVVAIEGLTEDKAPMNFTITRQVGSIALPGIDITSKLVLTRINRAEERAMERQNAA